MKENDIAEELIVNNHVDDPINMQGELGQMYNNLHDIKTRLMFLIDTKKKFAACELSDNKYHKIKKAEADEYSAIEADFINRYVVNGSDAVKAMIADTLGRINAENKYESYNQYKRNLQAFADSEDPDMIEDMSKWLVSQTGHGIDHMAISGLIDKFSSADEIAGISKAIDKAEKEYYTDKKFTKKQVATINIYADSREIYNYDMDDEDFEADRKQVLRNKDTKDRIDEDIYDRRERVSNRYKDGRVTNDKSQDLYKEEVLNKYLSFKTMEERLKYVLDLNTQWNSETIVYGKSTLSMDFLDKIYDNFIKVYIYNGTLASVRKVFKEFAKLNYEQAFELIGDKKVIDKQYASEGKVGQKKADVLLRSTVPGYYRNAYGKGAFYNKLSLSLQDVDEKSNYRSLASNTLLSTFNIREDMTVREYANALGITDETKVADFAAENNCNLDDTLGKMYQGMNKDDTDFNSQLKIQYFKDYINNILLTETFRIHDEKGLNEEDKKCYGDISDVFSKEPSYSKIEEWHEQEQANINKLDVSANRKILNDFDVKYTKGSGYDRYIMLHTGYDACKNDETKKIDCLSKAMAAVQLKNSGVPFDIKKIRKVATFIKGTKEFNDFISDKQAFDIAISDKASVMKANDEVYASHCVVPADKVSEFINDMNTVSENMMTKEGRSVQYGAVYDLIKKIGDLKGKYDFTQAGDREAAANEVTGLNFSLINATQIYIKDKEKVRTSTSGKERFNNALDGIGVIFKYADNAMPVIGAMVNTINEIREVNKHPSRHVNIGEYGAERAVKAKAHRLKKDKVEAKGKAM